MTIVAQRAEGTIDQGHQPREHLLPIRATKVAAKLSTENTELTTMDNGIVQDIIDTDAGMKTMTDFILACKLYRGTDTDITPKLSGGRKCSRMPIPDAGAQPRAVGCPRHGLSLKGSVCILCKFVFEARAPPTVRFPDLAPQNNCFHLSGICAHWLQKR